MQQPLRITFDGLDHSEAIAERIRAKAADLDRFHSQIMHCQVTVEAAHHSHHKGNLYAVRIQLHLPGKELVVSQTGQKPEHEDVYVAIRDAFAAAVRQLEDYNRKQRP
jgi:ribosomal subunit interface protein